MDARKSIFMQIFATKFDESISVVIFVSLFRHRWIAFSTAIFIFVGLLRRMLRGVPFDDCVCVCVLFQYCFLSTRI